jgi:hypothetical protein
METVLTPLVVYVALSLVKPTTKQAAINSPHKYLSKRPWHHPRSTNSAAYAKINVGKK